MRFALMTQGNDLAARPAMESPMFSIWKKPSPAELEDPEIRSAWEHLERRRREYAIAWAILKNDLRRLRGAMRQFIFGVSC